MTTTIDTHEISLRIAQQAEPRPITEVAAELGLDDDEIELYGRYKAKVGLDAIERRADTADGALICVTAITPTKAGEGKTTTAIALTEALGLLGERAALCLREPSMGPVFGIKGGGAGAGRAQVVPMEDLNLHFTGDMHAVTAANNLLAAMLDAHLLHGNVLGIDPLSITFRRCLDTNDRALRDIVVALGGRANGYPRETGFDITAASEVMALLAVARDLQDLRRRLGEITVAHTYGGERVTAEQLGAAGSMAVLLKDAIKPNLIQTLEGQPVFVHTGPFGNIASGNNSLVADRLALKLADFVVTESGFGTDMGFEKFAHIVAPLAGLRPSAVVVVATVKALREHGAGDLEAGAENLRRHIEIVRRVRARPDRRRQQVPGRHANRRRRRAQARARRGGARRRGERRLRAWRTGSRGAGRGGLRGCPGGPAAHAAVHRGGPAAPEDRGGRDPGLRRRRRRLLAAVRRRPPSSSPATASPACRSASPRRRCRSRTTRGSEPRRRGSHSRSRICVPTPGRAGSWHSAGTR